MPFQTTRQPRPRDAKTLQRTGMRSDNQYDELRRKLQQLTLDELEDLLLGHCLAHGITFEQMKRKLTRKFAEMDEVV